MIDEKSRNKMLKKRSICLAAGMFAASWALSSAQGHAPIPPGPVETTTEVCKLICLCYAAAESSDLPEVIDHDLKKAGD